MLAELQATEDDPSRDAEPGKIVHELRRGKAARTWFDRYYGTVDATPLYLVLLSEVWRWTDDTALVRRLRDPALAALRWIDEFGDRDGVGAGAGRSEPGRAAEAPSKPAAEGEPSLEDIIARTEAEDAATRPPSSAESLLDGLLDDEEK